MAQENENIKYEEEFIQNSRGVQLFTCRWIQENNKEPKALIFLCHGYGAECSTSLGDIASRLAKEGYAVYGIEYEGHGKSSGLRGYIRCINNLVNDCSDYFISVCEREENKEKARYLLGVSLGGAVAILLHRKEPTYWNGALLLAPMCKIDDKMKPHPLLIRILKNLCKIIPTWKVLPAKDMLDIAIKNPETRKEVRSNPNYYKGNLHLGTGHELLMVSLDIEKNLDQVSLPFLVVHGGDDRIIDPSVSKLLYEKASSEDKTLKVYPGMWHALTFGEPPEDVDGFYSDIVGWLDHRSMHCSTRREA